MNSYWTLTLVLGALALIAGYGIRRASREVQLVMGVVGCVLVGGSVWIASGMSSNAGPALLAALVWLTPVMAGVIAHRRAAKGKSFSSGKA